MSLFAGENPGKFLPIRRTGSKIDSAVCTGISVAQRLTGIFGECRPVKTSVTAIRISIRKPVGVVALQVD